MWRRDASTTAGRMPALQGAEPEVAASTADIRKFLIDRTGYIKLLEQEDTPEAYSRIENLRELVERGYGFP